MIEITKQHDVSDVVETMKMNGVSDQMEFHTHLTAFAELNKQQGESTGRAYARIFEDPNNAELREEYSRINSASYPYEMRKAKSSTPLFHARNPTLDGEQRAERQARNVVADEDRLANRGGKRGRKPGAKQGKRWGRNFVKAFNKEFVISRRG